MTDPTIGGPSQPSPEPSPQSPPAPQPTAPPRWQPLAAIDRRVAGVLVEKAKTTPEAYPMTLNSVCTACNQKSNRDPVMQLDLEPVAESLERLRHLGAVGLIEGSGRVEKFKHYLYDWLGVGKVEMAVMAELLLRGDQTEGDLRARASRMEPIRDLTELRPVLDSLMAKGLVISLTPQGRGHVVTHALYKPQELERLKAQYASGRAAMPADDEARSGAGVGASSAGGGGFSRPSFGPETVRSDVDALRAQVSRMQAEIEELRGQVQRLGDDFQRLRVELGS